MADVFLPYTQGQMAAGQLAGQQLTQLQGVLGLQRGMQEMQDQQALRGVLAQTGGNLEAAIPALIQAGRPEAAAKLGVLGHQMAQMRQQAETMRRQEEFRTRLPGLLQQYGPQQSTPAVSDTDPLTGTESGRPAVPGRPADYSGLGLAVAQYDPQLGLGFVQKSEDRDARVQAANEGRSQRMFELQMRLQDRSLDRASREAMQEQLMEMRRQQHAENLQARYDLNRGLQAVAGLDRVTPAVVSVNGQNVQALVDRAGNYYDATTRQPLRGLIGPQVTSADQTAAQKRETETQTMQSIESKLSELEALNKTDPSGVTGVAHPLRKMGNWALNQLPGVNVPSTAGQAVQIRDSILAQLGNLGRLSNADRERIENAFNVGTGGTQSGVQKGIELARETIRSRYAGSTVPSARTGGTAFGTIKTPGGATITWDK